jgi:hypothetical protein
VPERDRERGPAPQPSGNSWTRASRTAAKSSGRNVAEAGPGAARGRLAEQPQLAGGRGQQPEQQPDQGGLAGAVGADQADDLAGGDVEVDAVDRQQLAEPPAGTGPPRGPCAKSLNT